MKKKIESSPLGAHLKMKFHKGVMEREEKRAQPVISPRTDRRKVGCQCETADGKEIGKNDHRDRGNNVTLKSTRDLPFPTLRDLRGSYLFLFS
jgi:hypothetical protein